MNPALNYSKLTVSVAAGVLLAAGLIWLAIEGPSLYRAHERAKWLEQRKRAEQAFECGKPGACLAEKYAHALDLVRKHLASVEQATDGYCSNIGDEAPDPERRAQLVSECTTETMARLTRDLE